MNIRTFLKTFDISQAKIYPIVEDSLENYKISAPINISGAVRLTICLKIKEKDFTSNNAVNEVYSNIQKALFHVECIKCNTIRAGAYQFAAKITDPYGALLQINMMKCNINKSSSAILNGTAEFTKNNFKRNDLNTPLLFNISINNIEDAQTSLFAVAE